MYLSGISLLQKNQISFWPTSLVLAVQLTCSKWFALHPGLRTETQVNTYTQGITLATAQTTVNNQCIIFIDRNSRDSTRHMSLELPWFQKIVFEG